MDGEQFAEEAGVDFMADEGLGLADAADGFARVELRRLQDSWTLRRRGLISRR